MENTIHQNNTRINQLVSKARKDVKTFRKERFPKTEALMWLDIPEADKLIEHRLSTKQITEKEAEECKFFSNEGFIVYSDLFSEAEIDAANEDVNKLWLNDFKYDAGRKRLFNKHYMFNGINNLYQSEKIVDKLSLLINRKAIPYQSIISLYGSEQLTHSDAIHMTTFPLGFLTATWIALEDIHIDSGPLVYYPKSHKLDYYLSDAVGIQENDYEESGYDMYHKKYEPFVQDILKKNNFEEKTLLAKKGDVLIWHHNLLHGGKFINDKTKTRKSLVCHYFAENVICYHDLANSCENLMYMKLRNRNTFRSALKLKNLFGSKDSK